MGDDNKDKEEVGKVTPRREQIYDWGAREREKTGVPTALENEFAPFSQDVLSRYQDTADMQTKDYTNLRGGYQKFREGLTTPRVNYSRSPETDFALGGYRDFANTGGYSPTDIQELRARGVSPIRSAYANAVRNLDRQRSLQGGYSPNYTAAVASMQRTMPGQLADATTNVNAQLADAIRQGKLAGLSGFTGISEAEAGRGMQTQQLNQAAELANRNMRLASLEGEKGLYGTTPGLASTFGNQALQAYQQRQQMEQARNQYGLGLTEAQLRALGQPAPEGKPWWQTAIDVGGNLGTAAILASSKELKENINPADETRVLKSLAELDINTWNYIGDDTKHIGPMAEELQEKFGVGDGKTINLVDVVGIAFVVMKNLARQQVLYAN